jgi:hypothetical protein
MKLASQTRHKVAICAQCRILWIKTWATSFLGMAFQRIVHQTEILWDIPVLSGIAFHECLQIGAALPARLKERFDAIGGNRGVR